MNPKKQTVDVWNSYLSTLKVFFQDVVKNLTDGHVECGHKCSGRRWEFHPQNIINQGLKDVWSIGDVFPIVLFHCLFFRMVELGEGSNGQRSTKIYSIIADPGNGHDWGNSVSIRWNKVIYDFFRLSVIKASSFSLHCLEPSDKMLL